MSQQNDLEYFLKQEVQRRSIKWLWAALGPVGFLVIIVVIICCGVGIALTGGTQYGLPTYVGSSQALPSSWINLVNQDGGSLPNVVILGDIEQESSGQADAMNFNLSNGTASNTEPIGQPGVTIKSVDAGLMQINSGPGWPQTPKWNQVFGTGHDPTDPAPNIKEGVKELNQATRQNGGYLSEGLSAYNTGSGNSVVGSGYAGSILSNINSFEGAEADCWATGNYAGQSHGFLWWSWGARQWDQPAQNASTWIMVAGSYAEPANNAETVTWAPPPEQGQPPVTYSWYPAEPPSKVTISGIPATLAPKDAPILPGQTIFAAQVTRPGSYTATCEWDWDTYVYHKNGSPTVVHHKKTINTPTIEICAPGTPANSVAALGGTFYASSASLQYQAVNPNMLISWLSAGPHDSALANMTDAETIISAAQAHNVNPLLLFAVTGAEQDFDDVRYDSPGDVAAIAENPFNVGGSWQNGGYTLAESADACANFLAERLSAPPPDGESAIEWINDPANPNGGLYASENGQPTPNWWENVSGFFEQMSQWPGMYVTSAH